MLGVSREGGLHESLDDFGSIVRLKSVLWPDSWWERQCVRLCGFDGNHDRIIQSFVDGAVHDRDWGEA